MKESFKTRHEQPATRVAVKELISYAGDVFDFFESKTDRGTYDTELNQEIVSLTLLPEHLPCTYDPENNPTSIELNKLASDRLNPVYINYRDRDKCAVKSFKLHYSDGGQVVAELLTSDDQSARLMSAHEASVILKRLSYPILMHKLGASHTGVISKKM